MPREVKEALISASLGRALVVCESGEAFGFSADFFLSRVGRVFSQIESDLPFHETCRYTWVGEEGVAFRVLPPEPKKEPNIRYFVRTGREHYHFYELGTEVTPLDFSHEEDGEGVWWFQNKDGMRQLLRESMVIMEVSEEE